MKRKTLILLASLCLVGCNEEIATEKPLDYSNINIKSNSDYDKDGKDDFTEFVTGGRAESVRHPRYDGAYIGENNGYPTRDTGVCTDVIWRSFKEAGYSLRSMVNEDIKNHPERYPMVETPNTYIDFRRVKTIRPFFEAYCEVLPNDLTDPKDWQPGDIVIFNPRDYHIGILSDKRNKKGYPYVFHNEGQSEREEDFLRPRKVSGHYRFKAENIPAEILKPWQPGEAGETNE